MNEYLVALLPVAYAFGVFCGGLLNECYWRRIERPRQIEMFAWWLRVLLHFGELEARVIAYQILTRTWQPEVEEHHV